MLLMHAAWPSELFTELSVCAGCEDIDQRADYKGEIMSISEIIAPQLPYLRRFARVLSGSQESGDAYVVAMLEAIAAEPSMFPVDLEPRVATYQELSRRVELGALEPEEV